VRQSAGSERGAIAVLMDVNFGSDHAGLSTVGYKVYGPDGSVLIGRTTAGVFALAGGAYAADVDLPAGTSGVIYWDAAAGSAVYATERFDTAAAQTAADAVLRRSLADVEASGDTVLNSLYGVSRMALHAVPSADGGSVIIYRTDGSSLGAVTLQTDPAAQPVVGTSS
jgi:hypothetical protein